MSVIKPSKIVFSVFFLASTTRHWSEICTHTQFVQFIAVLTLFVSWQIFWKVSLRFLVFLLAFKSNWDMDSNNNNGSFSSDLLLVAMKQVVIIIRLWSLCGGFTKRTAIIFTHTQCLSHTSPIRIRSKYPCVIWQSESKKKQQQMRNVILFVLEIIARPILIFEECPSLWKNVYRITVHLMGVV